MTVTIERIGPDIAFSVFRFLRETQYAVGAQTAKLTGHFAGLTLLPAYPDDLLKISTPVLALAAADSVMEAQDYFGEELEEDLYTATLFGFVVGQGNDAANKRYRDRLLNDCVQLLRRVAQIEGIPLFDHASQAEKDGQTIEVLNVRGRLIPANAPEIEVERYKFLVETGIPVE